MKELVEEIRFCLQHPVLTVLTLGTVTGILPAIICGIGFKILGL